jgi:hypothetical protein
MHERFATAYAGARGANKKPGVTPGFLFQAGLIRSAMP